MKLKLHQYDKGNHWGKVFKLKSERFGIHVFLCTKYPDKFNSSKYIQLDSKWANTIFYSSVCDDIVLQVWNSMEEYIQSCIIAKGMLKWM